MKNAFATINRLEKSTVEGEPVIIFREVRHEFILLGCILGALFAITCALFRENLTAGRSRPVAGVTHALLDRLCALGELLSCH
jgi:hypothetical protein